MKPEIPSNHQSITATWLNEALRSSLANGEQTIQSFEIEQLSGGQVGKIARLVLDYSADEHSKQASVIVKLSHSDPKIRAHMDQLNLYEKEVRFYRELAPQLELPIPQCYYMDYDEASGNSVLLLEDLSDLKEVSRIDGCSLEEAELVIIQLAGFHARWWNNSLLQATDYLTPFDHMATYSQSRYQEWWPEFLTKLDSEIPELTLPVSFRNVVEKYGPHLAATLSKLNEPPITLVHRDVNVDNIRFGVEPDDPALVVLDWQLFGYGRGVTDVAYFMIFGVPIETRRNAEYNLLKNYHGSLEKQGVQGYDFKQCWADYKLSFFRNLSVAVSIITLADISHPYLKSTVKAVLPRIIAFGEDHEVSNLL